MSTLKSVLGGVAAVVLMAAPVAHATEVKILFSFALPPYVINEDGKGASGFEYEILSAALAHKGHTVKPVFVAMGAIPKNLMTKQADGAQRGAPELREADGYFYADEPTVEYEDVVISIKANKVAVNSMADLKGLRIIAFQGASTFLGPDYAAAVKGNDKYAESSDEKRRVQQLYAGGVQAYVGDLNVFKYYKGLAIGVDTTPEFAVHRVFTPSRQTINHAVFRDKQVRDDFNAGLKKLKASGQYKLLVKKYIKE